MGSGGRPDEDAPGGDVYSFRTYSSAGALYPVELYLACAELEGLEAGVYHFHPRELALRQLRRGDVRGALAEAAVAPELTEAAAVLVLLVDLGPVLDTLGNRGYRAAQLEAGIRTGRIYLGAYARDLAATASTFYDDDVTRFVAPGTSKSALLAAAVGHPAT